MAWAEPSRSPYSRTRGRLSSAFDRDSRFLEHLRFLREIPQFLYFTRRSRGVIQFRAINFVERRQTHASVFVTVTLYRSFAIELITHWKGTRSAIWFRLSFARECKRLYKFWIDIRETARCIFCLLWEIE